MGQQPASARLPRSLRAAADPTRLNPFPAPERIGKRVRSTTPTQIDDAQALEWQLVELSIVVKRFLSGYAERYVVSM